MNQVSICVTIFVVELPNQLSHINVFLLQEYNGLIVAIDTRMYVRSIASLLFKLCSDKFTRNVYVCFFSLIVCPSGSLKTCKR